MKFLSTIFIGVLTIVSLFFFAHPATLFAAGLPSFDLGSIWNFIVSLPMDHPIASIIISFLMVKGGPIIWFLLHVLKSIRDKYFDDTEAAGSLWRLAAIVNGFWPNKSRKIILTYAPRHWHPVILEGKDPTFRLVAVPSNRVIEVQNMLSGKPPPVPSSETPGPAGGP